MKPIKKMTISAMMVALCVAMMTLGALVGTLDLTAAALSSLCMAFIYIEVGAPYPLVSWLCASLLSFVCFPHSMLWAQFLLFFGIYPTLKGYIERLPRAVWWGIKLVWFNATLWLFIGLLEWVFSTPFFTGELWRRIALYAVCNVAFLAYDLFLTFAVRLYVLRYRDKLKKYLK